MAINKDVERYLLKTFSSCKILAPSKWLDLVKDTLATPPIYTTIRVNVLKYNKEEVLLALREVLGKQYTRRGGTLPAILSHSSLPDVLFMSNIGPQGVVPASKQVVVGVACAMAVLKGAEVFVPGVLGAPKYLAKGDRVAIVVDMEKKCLKGATEPYSRSTLFIGNGVSCMSRDEMIKTKSGTAIEMTEPLYIAPSLNGIGGDMVYAQTLPSIIAGHVLSPRPGEVVLDMCAAPGGKTSHIATLMENTGVLVALDKVATKVDRLQLMLASYGLVNVQCYTHDATCIVDKDNIRCLPGSPPYNPETFDRILLDGPCSGLGQRPLLNYDLTEASFCSYQPFQRKLLSQAVSLLKCGGTLVYSTCTVTPEENELQVKWLLDTFPSMLLIDQEPHNHGYPGLPGYGLEDGQRDMVQRYGPTQLYAAAGLSRVRTDFPDHAYDTIGFFIAKFTKQ